MESCAKCTNGPTGSGGHDDLFSYSFQGSSLGMKCAACGRMWLRRAIDPTHFEWNPTTSSEGALLPQG